MHCYLNLSCLENNKKLTCSSTLSAETRHNEQVKKNRLILRGFIDAVCHLGNQDLPFRGNDYSCISLNKKNFRELSHCVENF